MYVWFFATVVYGLQEWNGNNETTTPTPSQTKAGFLSGTIFYNTLGDGDHTYHNRSYQSPLRQAFKASFRPERRFSCCNRILFFSVGHPTTSHKIFLCNCKDASVWPFESRNTEFVHYQSSQRRPFHGKDGLIFGSCRFNDLHLTCNRQETPECDGECACILVWRPCTGLRK